jgi:polyphosphate kinase
MKQPVFFNRELSWAEFNQRVLNLAKNDDIPLMERVKFLAITGSNLDEFFMVRVGGLQLIEASGRHSTDPAGMTPTEQLDAISDRIHRMAEDQYECFHMQIENRLARAGIRRIKPGELSERQNAHIQNVFEHEIFPILSPMVVSDETVFPPLVNHLFHVGVRLRPEPGTDKPRFALIPVGKNMSRFLALPGETGYPFMLIEDAIGMFVERFFPGETIIEHVPFRITRNADMSVREDLTADLLSEMQAVLEARKRSDCVRLEVNKDISKIFLEFLQKTLRIKSRDIYDVSDPIDVSSLAFLSRLGGYATLKDKPWPPQPSSDAPMGESMFKILSRSSILLNHPYDSFEPVVRLLNEAADDPDVVAIKQILYRTSRNSPIVAALMRAADRGKYVTAVVELKARFDEARNIEWAKEMEDAGVQVIYGVKGLKTHAKLCLIVRREPQGLQRYMHFGTGNYNEITAQIYSDISYMTCDEDLGADASAFFNAITGYSQPQKFRKLNMAPISLRERLLELIESEKERKRQGQKAHIMAKVNSLVDPKLIETLYAASQEGVKIDLNIRGVCCLRPGVPKLSENISVVSIVGRFLEHSRVFYFRHGGEERVLISSADWMPRNLDRRVELLVPVDDPACRKRLIDSLNLYFTDNTDAWRLLPDGTYERVRAGSRKSMRSQEWLYDQARERARRTQQAQRTTFEPHRPPSATTG